MECALTFVRIREGNAKAKKYGTRTGRPIDRPPRKVPASFKKFHPMCKDGEITVTDFARLIGVSRPTLYKYVQEFDGK
jgi:DNA invertase Pin-like site-specific DNA recombinase